MMKKQGIIQAKITSKPSFKNLINLEHQKVSSRSKSKSKKNLSQNKISSVPNKSPKKIIPRIPDNYNNVPFVSERTIQTSVREQNVYENVNSEFNQSQLSAKKTNQIQQFGLSINKDSNQISRSDISKVSTKSRRDKSIQQNMKKIILMKNKTVQVQKILADEQEYIQKLQMRKQNSVSSLQTNKQIKKNTTEETLKLKKIQNNLDLYLSNLVGDLKTIEKKYYVRLQEQQRKVNYQQAISMLQQYQVKRDGVVPSMIQLETRLKNLEQLLS